MSKSHPDAIIENATDSLMSLDAKSKWQVRDKRTGNTVEVVKEVAN